MENFKCLNFMFCISIYMQVLTLNFKNRIFNSLSYSNLHLLLVRRFFFHEPLLRTSFIEHVPVFMARRFCISSSRNCLHPNRGHWNCAFDLSRRPLFFIARRLRSLLSNRNVFVRSRDAISVDHVSLDMKYDVL